MELTAEQQKTLKQLRDNDPLVKRRESMLMMARSLQQSIEEPFRKADEAIQQHVDLARTHYVATLTGKGVEPAVAQTMVDEVEKEIAAGIDTIGAMLGQLATRQATRHMLAALPAHLRTQSSFAVEPKVRSSLGVFLEGREDDYIAMMRCLDPFHYDQRGTVIGERKRDDVLLEFDGSNAPDSAQRMTTMLNELKQSLGIEGLFVTARDGEAHRGRVLNSTVTVEASTIVALVDAFKANPDAFKEVAERTRSAGKARA